MKIGRSISIQKEWSATNNKGFSLVEALLGVAVFGLLITGTIGAFVYGRESNVIAGNRTRAIFLAEEGLEVMANMKDQNFGLLHNKTGGLQIAGSQWVFFGANDQTGIFTRVLEVGVLDNVTRMVTSTVIWQQNSQRDGIVTLVRKFTNWLIKSLGRSSFAEFDAGNKNSVEAVDVSGGEVETAATGDWTTFISTKEYDSDGTGDVNDLDVHFASQLMVTVANVTTGDELNVLDISDITSTNITKLGGLDYSFNLKDVDVYDGYAYVATEDDNELLIIRLSDVTQVNTYNLPDTANAEAIKVVDSVAYIGTLSSASEEFYALDVSDPEGIIVELGSVEITGNIYSIDVVDGYAYLATSVNTEELTVVRLSDYTNINSYSTGSNDMYDVVVEDNKAYLAGVQSGSAEVYIVDVSDPEGTLSNLGSAQIAGNANGIDVNDDGTIFVASSDDAGEIYSFDGSSYTQLGKQDITGTDNILGINAYGGHVYVVGTADSAETLVYQSGITTDSVIYIDAIVNPWVLSTVSASANESETMTVNSGINSLSVNYTDVNGYARFSNSIDLTNFVTLEFYLNTISPWAFAAYNNTAPHIGTAVVYDNTVHGSTYDRNLSVFTDFPVPDMAAFKTIAQASGSYLNPSGDLTLNENPKKLDPQISPYEGKLVYVEFQTPGDTLTLDFDDVVGTYNISWVTNGNIIIKDYAGITMNTYSSNYPVFLSDNYDITFGDNQNLTVGGFIYAGGEVISAALRSPIQISLSGFVMAGLLDASFERFNITYATDWHASPPPNFGPDYSGQNFDISASSGNTLALTDYLAAGIDNDISTWEFVEIDIPDFNATNITYLQFAAPDTDTTNHTTWFVDDIKMIGDSSLKIYRALGAFTSAAIDSGDVATTWSDIAWQSSSTSTTNYLEFQIRTAADNTGVPGIWSKWSGPTNGEDFFTDFTGQTQLTNTIHRDGASDQWLQYRAIFYGVATSSPILESVSIRYNN